MWMLVYVAIFPDNAMLMETWGKYASLEECQYEMRENEIAINLTNESMTCLEIPPSLSDVDEWGKGEPGDGSLY